VGKKCSTILFGKSNCKNAKPNLGGWNVINLFQENPKFLIVFRFYENRNLVVVTHSLSFKFFRRATLVVPTNFALFS